MGTHSDGYVEQELLTTFVTCEGDLSDPQFNTKFARLLKQLQKLLLKDPGQYLGVVKVEPWNSVRVTFTVPKEAALRLRQLAQQGDATLSQLGILSVQLEGDQAISLRIAGRVSGESQEIVLRTTPADNESMSSQTPSTEADHMISKTVAVSASGGTASLIRTMTQLVSGAGVNQPLSSFKGSSLVSSVNVNPSFSVSPKVSSSAVISTANKTTLPHSYHSPFLPSNSTPVVSSPLNRDSPNNLISNGPRFPLPPPPPYPYLKNPTHPLKLNRSLNEEMTVNPSPANVALSSPLLVNLLQNDGGVPLNNSKSPVMDKQKTKSNVKSATPASTAKRKDSTPEAFATINHSEMSDSSPSSFANNESHVIQKIQRTPTSLSEPLTMVTNVRIPVESCNSESVIVSSGKLPAMNHVAVATANIKQNFANQNQLVNIYQGQLVPAGSSTSNSPKVALSANQFVNRVTSVSVETQQVLTVGQAQKFGVRVINVPSSQQHLLQPQQLASTQLLQQPFQSHTQQFTMQQQQQQQLLQPQKSVILSQSTPSAGKINVSSVQELNKLCINQNSPIVSSVMVSNNRLVNQFPLNTLPQVSNVLPASYEQKFDGLVVDRTSTSEGQTVSDETDKSTMLTMSGVLMADGAPCHMKKSDSITSLPNGNRVTFDSVVTSAALHLVKTLTFTNPNLTKMNNGSTQEPKVNGSSKFGSIPSQTQMPQTIISSNVGTSFNTSPCTFPNNSIVTNSNAVSNEKYFDPSIVRKTNQTNDLQAIVFSTSETNVVPDSCKVYQSAKVVAVTTVPHSVNHIASVATSSALMPDNQSSSYVSSTSQLPQYSQNSSCGRSLNKEDTFQSDERNATSPTSNSSQPSSSGEKEPQFLINPLTGEMEAMPTESSDNESDNLTDVFSSLPPSVANNDDSCFSYSSPVANEKSSMHSDDDGDDLVTSFSLRKSDVDHSNIDAVKSLSGDAAVGRHRTLPAGTSPNSGSCAGAEKIKIRLKLEKSEPVCNAYKVDVLKTGIKKIDKPTSIVKPMPRVLTTCSSSTNNQNSIVNVTVEEPRVPPLRLTLLGKNMAFVKKNKKCSEEINNSLMEEASGDKKSYLNRNKISPCDIISEKECLSSDLLEMCKLGKSLDNVDDGDDLKMKLLKTRKSVESEEAYSLPSSDTIGDGISSFSNVLSSVRTFPTEAEVTSILRSVPTDPHNKMSLSSMKIKKKESKKTRDRASLLSNSTNADDSTDTFTRVINETKCSLSSQSRGKTKTTPTSLLKKVMKSGAADARFMNMANRNSDNKRSVSGNGNTVANETPPAVIAKSTSVSTGTVHQRRSSADITYSGSGGVFSNTKQNQRSSEAVVTPPPQYAPTNHVSNHLYGNVTAVAKETKKFAANSISAKKVANNCKMREYHSGKHESQQDFHLGHEIKKGIGHLSKKNMSLDVECKQHNIANCLQVESNSSMGVLGNITHVDLSEKVVSQRLSEDNTLDEPVRKKQRLDSSSIGGNGSTNGSPLMERLIALPNSKESGEIVTTVGGDSPSGHTTEQTNNQGEDSGIESMDALSEKSPNQGESPGRKDEKEVPVMGESTGNLLVDKKSTVNAYCDKQAIDNFAEKYCGNALTVSSTSSCERDVGSSINEKTNHSSTVVSALNDGSSKCSANSNSLGVITSQDTYAEEEANVDKADCKTFDRTDSLSPDLDDVQPFRVTPALYTYSNPEKMRVDSPSPVLEDISDEISLSPKPVVVEQPKTSTRLKRKRKESKNPMYITADRNKTSIGRYNNRGNSGLGGKSLLEQLLIEIPSDSSLEIRRSGMSTRNTRSQMKGLSQPSPDTLSVCSTSSSSSVRTPKCSPVSRSDDCSKPSSRPSSRVTSRRSRKVSESSNVSNSDESNASGIIKRKLADSASELMKACMGFEDQNCKKTAITAPSSLDCYRPLISENSIITSPSVVVSNNKTDGRSTAGMDRKMINSSETVPPSSSTTRPVGKRKKTMNETANKRGAYKSHASADLFQVGRSEVQGPESKHVSMNLVSSTSLRGNSRSAGSTSSVNTTAMSQIPSISVSSRRSICQNHVTRRRKSLAATTTNTTPVEATIEDKKSSSLNINNNAINNNCTNNINNNNNHTDISNCNNKSNNNINNNNDNGCTNFDDNNCDKDTNINNNNAPAKMNINNNEGGSMKTMHYEKSIISTTVDKVENKSITKLNYVTKKDSSINLSTSSSSLEMSMAAVNNICGNGSNSKGISNNSSGCSSDNGGVTSHGGNINSSGAMVTTRSVKHTHHIMNESSIIIPIHDLSQTHIAPASEEVINTRRKTRSVANLNGT